MKVAIGVPGQAARVYVDAEKDLIAGSVRAGEVAVELPDLTVFFNLPSSSRISEDGKTLVAPATVDEMPGIRAARYGLLQACDWTQLPDAALTDDEKAAWAKYRQALRDLPAAQPGATPATVVWPKAPQ